MDPANPHLFSFYPAGTWDFEPTVRQGRSNSFRDCPFNYSGISGGSRYPNRYRSAKSCLAYSEQERGQVWRPERMMNQSTAP